MTITYRTPYRLKAVSEEKKESDGPKPISLVGADRGAALTSFSIGTTSGR